MDGTKERQGDFVFTANDEGEYRFCFNNEMSTFAEKMVDFEIAVRAPFHPTIIPDTSFFESLTPPQLQQWISQYSSRYEKSLMSNPGVPQVENEVRAQLPSKQGAGTEQTSVLEESILKLSAQLSTISRNQKYFRTRENRNFSTVKSTEKRIFNFSMMEVGLMVTMAGLQVFIVRFFFQGARKGECCSEPIRYMYFCAKWYYRLRMSTPVRRHETTGFVRQRENRQGLRNQDWPTWRRMEGPWQLCIIIATFVWDTESREDRLTRYHLSFCKIFGTLSYIPLKASLGARRRTVSRSHRPW